MKQSDAIKCDCAEWKKNMALILGVFKIAAIHGCGVTVKRFGFCPWCGKKLIPEVGKKK